MDKQTLSCKSNNASISLFFNISDKGNDFFKFTENIDNGLDLSLLLDQSAGLHSNIIGYVGTDTSPPCSRYLCWYIY